MVPYTFLHPKEALSTLPRTSRVVVTWYSRNSGQRFAAAKVVKVGDRSMRIRLWPVDSKSTILVLKLRDLELRAGKLAYYLRLPSNEREAASVARLESKYLQQKLGWRYTAKLRYAVLSNWQHWAQMRYDAEHHYEQLTDWRYRASLRLEEMLRCGR